VLFFNKMKKKGGIEMEGTRTEKLNLVLSVGDYVRDNETERVMEITYLDDNGIVFDDVYFVFSLDFAVGLIQGRFEKFDISF